MQVDMHYYGTFALARAAGLKPDVCKVIATASQFVDDNAATSPIEFQDGGRIDAQATAHHVSDIIVNRDVKDQRRVWVPFHFLPGNEGETFSERMLCRKNSKVARLMVKHHLGCAGQDFGVCLIGITAHIYADTFSHFGFSGVGSRRNRVDNESFEFNNGLDPDMADYLEKKAEDFFLRYGDSGGWVANVKSWLAETVSGALGHGAVATYPDRPYLKWCFTYEYPKKLKVSRDNPKDFLDCCFALHKLFTRFGRANQVHSDKDGVAFDGIRNAISAILRVQGKKEERINQWCTAAKNGAIGSKKFRIPRYKPEAWLKESSDMIRSKKSQTALGSHLYRFYQAASIHRQFVLRELLPDQGLIVS